MSIQHELGADLGSDERKSGEHETGDHREGDDESAQHGRTLPSYTWRGQRAPDDMNEVMAQRARGYVVQDDSDLGGYKLQHQVESYMLYQGKKLVPRFDANSYLRVLGAWQSFDLAGKYGDGELARALAPCHGQYWLNFTIDSDVCFYPEEQQEISQALKANDINYQHITVHSDKGHDSFLLEPELYTPHIHFLLTDMLRQARAQHKSA